VKRLLIIDDEPDILELLEMLFQDHYIVVTASDGQSALEMLPLVDVDAILLDLHMPGMSGQDVVRELRKLENPPPVIIYSAAYDLEKQASNLGAAGALSKTASPEDIIAAVEQALSGAPKRMSKLSLAN
jgi:CheY-like chemotaxis protein